MCGGEGGHQDDPMAKTEWRIRLGGAQWQSMGSVSQEALGSILSMPVLMRLEDEGQGWQGRRRLSVFEDVRFQETGPVEA